MNDNLARRNVLAAVLAAMTLPAVPALAAPSLRGNDTARLALTKTGPQRSAHR